MFRALGVVVVLAVVAACGSPRPMCNPGTCRGCCTTSGACETGNTTKACGTGGLECRECVASYVCIAGSCLPGGSGGSGGSSGTGGGSGTAGGFTSAGGGSGTAGGLSSAGGGSGTSGGIATAGGGGTGGGFATAGGGTGTAGGFATAGGGGTAGGAASCDTGLGTTATDFAKAMGLCTNVTSASFVTGNVLARKIRATFGSSWSVREGTQMVHLSTGKAIDRLETTTHNASPGYDYGTSQAQSFYVRASCSPTSTTTPPAHDVTELSVALTVPSGMTRFSFDYNFFSSEYPAYLCTQFTDRFVVAVNGVLTQGNVLLTNGQPLTSSSNLLTTCASYNGPNSDFVTVNRSCTGPVSLLSGTGYGLAATSPVAATEGAATGWLTTSFAVQAGETLTVRFIILDEGDGKYDSAVLLDNARFLP